MGLSPTAAYLLNIVFSQIPTAVSYTLMKLAHHKIEEQNKEGLGSVKVYGTWYFVIAILCAIGGGIFNVLMLPYLTLVLVSTMTGI